MCVGVCSHRLPQPTSQTYVVAVGIDNFIIVFVVVLIVSCVIPVINSFDIRHT